MLARLAIIHLVHEARGLDVNPVTISKFEKVRIRCVRRRPNDN